MRHLVSALFRDGTAATGSPLERRLRRISALERKEEARHFLDQFHDASSAGRAGRQARWAEVRRSLSRRGWYEHTPDELAFGARLAWRNTGRCIGRLYWESLDVVDCRHLTEPSQINSRLISHLGEAQADGRVRSTMSVFRPVQGRDLPCWIESPQLVQYACHPGLDGVLLGDRQNVEATRIAQSMGWRPADKPGPFDLLPLFIRDRTDRRHMFALPEGAVREIDICHPDSGGFDALSLRWYAVPLVTNMILTIGGIDYPCAPFNGFYMGTEIASRNFGDAKRYDLVPQVARALGHDINEPGPPLWRDIALTELNRAVLHSFRAAGVTMVDHHSASDQFMTFHQREQAAGRRVPGDWRWLLPPQAGSASEIFHLRMRNFHPVPNFYRDRGGDGLRLMPWYGDRYNTRVQMWQDRITRRWKLWKRMPW
ncbi:nitric oxide synthase oxygenase [Fuscibacter oryzae]|uniref:Nitric oxide synthase oxygenase n=1 Tax=Fuscibacter oryzae TaxID=2803939 RepID=A0A8J7MWJ8_9RHOB|nr:nitric oxide synthase oxygenase [Fuscibacter oryzae]MBL4929993.1 nitric oxide synthase oxygenase [Fuscibacter oryzae]